MSPTPSSSSPDSGLFDRVRRRLSVWWDALRDKVPRDRASHEPPAKPETSTPTEAEIDRTIDASFPASDPPSWTATGTSKSS